MKFSYAIYLAFYLHGPGGTVAFSTSRQGYHLDVDPQDLDRDKRFFFITPVSNNKKASIDGGSSPGRDNRKRYRVEYISDTAQPVVESTEKQSSRTAVVDKTESVAKHASTGSIIDPSLGTILASSAGGLWTVTPIVYWHCMDQNMLDLFPLMIMAGAMEVVAMLIMMLVHRENTKRAIALFAALRVGAGYLLSVPMNFSYEVIEGLVLAGSSLLVWEALSLPQNTKSLQSL